MLSSNLDVPYEVKAARKNGIINKYNPFTILNELEWACGEKEFNQEVFIFSEGKYIDPNLKQGEKAQNLSLALQFRKNLNEYFNQLKHSDLLVVTLGMIECWYDSKTSTVLNMAPPPKAILSEPDRYKFTMLEVSDIVECLDKIYAISQRLGVSKMIITTSPVTLGRTFRDKDIIVSNCFSKSTLRVASEIFSEKYNNVDYFPSFETVTYGDRRLTYQNCLSHASDYVVSNIISEFLFRYFNKNSTVIESDKKKDDAEISEMIRLKAQLEKYKNALIKHGVDMSTL